jgi:hypothetical protein
MEQYNVEPVGLGTNDVFAATVYGSSLRIGGKFTVAGGVDCSRLAGWNGTQWFQMPSGATNGQQHCIRINPFGAKYRHRRIFTVVSNGINANRVVGTTQAAGYTPLGTGVDNNAVVALAGYRASLCRRSFYNWRDYS